ncbi:MAG: 6,7-dimethyl-8-ribityllumazine synthase [Planctomycetes bacterium]|nr:6,7-dimethyl-8-ribityllumazine synthase [Planctomycetota bacterium]
MAQTLSAKLDATSQRFAIVVSRFNELIGTKLLDGATDTLIRHGAEPADITHVWVPGAFEIPLAAKKLATSGRYAAVLALGCVIRGQTPHFDYIANEVTKGVAQVSLATEVPIALGVITADTLEQAIDRAGGKHGNKGTDAARTAIEMANLLALLSKPG